MTIPDEDCLKLVHIYNLQRPLTKTQITKEVIGYIGSSATKKINEFINLDVLAPNGSNLYVPNKGTIILLLRESGMIRKMINVLTDKEVKLTIVKESIKEK